MKFKYIIYLAVIVIINSSNNLFGHCQVPCGIYDDAVRIVLLKEHVATIEKAMNQIEQLSQSKRNAQNMNQLTRWVNTKEEHATLIQSMVADYFLAQRIKPKKKNEDGRQLYVDQTLVLQQIIVATMKCKQNVDNSRPKEVNKLLNQFVNLYFDDHGKEHLRNLEND